VNETTLPANIEAAKANLPKTYEAAKKALQECQEIDECKEWADKAAALASYARQAEDHTLQNLAQRIHIRARRRVGELSMELGLAPRGGAGGSKLSSGGKIETLKAGGVSPSAAHRAERIARIPEPEFEAAMASEVPPTATELAALGAVPRPKASAPAPTPADCAERVTTALRDFATFCNANDPEGMAASPGLNPVVADGFCSTIENWLARFWLALSEELAD